MKLSGVMLGTENPKVLGEFYAKVLGDPGWTMGDWCGFNVDGGYLTIGPHSEVKGTNTSPGRQMIILQTEQVKEEAERIKATGAQVVAEPYQPEGPGGPSDMWIATFADPDGNYFQLSTPWRGEGS